VAVRVHLHVAVTICSIYIPPSESLTTTELTGLIGQLPEPILLLGDFNAHHPLWGSPSACPRGNLLSNFLLDSDFVVLNNSSPTYFHTPSKSFSHIDLSILSSGISSHFAWSVQDDTMGSDHFPVCLRLLSSYPSEQGRIPKWIFPKANWDVFQETITFPHTVDSFATVEGAVSYFVDQVIATASASIPKSLAAPLRTPVPWWNQECASALQTRKQALATFRRCPTTANLLIYKRAKGVARKIIKLSKRTSWRNYVSTLTSSSSSSQVWKRIRRIQKKFVPLPLSFLSHGNSFLTTTSDIAEKLASTFSEVSRTASRPQPFQQYKSCVEKRALNFNSSNSEVYNNTFSSQELFSALRISRNTAVGGDDIHYEMIRHLPSTGTQFLLELFNRIWRTGDFPPSWRHAIVLPFPKPGKDHSIATNYRPIALTSCLCKLMERMVNFRLVWFLEYYKHLSPNQSGFRKHRSTLDNLIQLDTSIRNAFLKKQHLVAVFFDIEKAYDTAWKFGILKELHQFGLRGHLPLFIQQFLTTRVFQVRLGTTLSSLYPQDLGVPQGSVLSVTLFSVAINSVVRCIPASVDSLLYVDDLTIYVVSKQQSFAERRIQQALDRLAEWSSKTGFQFSASKSICVHFHRQRGLFHAPSLHFNGSSLPVKSEVKYLGLIFDSRLTWIAQIKALRIKCLKALNLLKVVSSHSWGADRAVLLRLYRALIRSKLDYGCQAYGSASKSALKLLDPIHNAALRICVGAFRTSPIESLYVEAHEPSLTNRRQQLGLQYYARLQGLPHLPTNRLVNDDSLDSWYGRRVKIPRPFGVHARQALCDLNISFPSISPIHVRPRPFWLLPSISACDILALDKDHMPSEVVKQEFLSHLAGSHHCHHLYTDGSKSPNGVGCAMVDMSGVPYTTFIHLPDSCSIFTAELRGILMALHHIASRRYMDSAIFTDSQSALQVIQQQHTSDPLLLGIHSALFDLHQKHCTVSFCWVPSHMGLRGNELADRAAKAACHHPVSASLVPARDCYVIIKQAIKSSWQTSWDSQLNNKLHSIKPLVEDWPQSYHKHRLTETKLCRLRIGHTYLTHKYLLVGANPPSCPHCDVPLTMKHVLAECVHHAPFRRRLLAPSLAENLRFNLDRVMEFLTLTQLLAKI
jgi:ribonuclease HI